MEEWILSLNNPAVISLVLCLALMGGAVGLPIPEDLPLVTAGVLVHSGTITAPLALIVCYFGVVFGDLIIFSLGWKFGPSLFETRWFRARFPPRRVSDIRSSIEKRSLLMIFVARHLFYLRTATFLTCGAVKMNPWRFILADLVAALVSVPLMIWIGFKFAENIDLLWIIVDYIKDWSIGIAVALIVSYLILRRIKKKRALKE